MTTLLTPKSLLLEPCVPARMVPPAVLRRLRLLVILIFTLGWAGAVAQDNIFDSKADELRCAQEQLRAVNEVQLAGSAGNRTRDILLVLCALMLGVALAFPKIIALATKRINLHTSSPSTAENTLMKLRAEAEAFSEFAAAFRTGAAATSGNSGSGDAGATPEINPLNEFLAKTPRLLGDLRRLLQQMAAKSDTAARLEVLSELQRSVRMLKGEAGYSELLPVWQTASALEGLLKQLTDKADNINASTLRTVAGGVDVLGELCQPGLQADLLTNPPLRLLVVDDDPICRMAVSSALKKALNPPDLAENGEAALTLTAKQAYDMIFLDVLMPGMDGYEVCTRIHETTPNAQTPVVFVTMLSDFEGRATATIKGGTDLIGKPFLSFEITVKALTFALRSRLQARTQIVAAPNHLVKDSKVAPPAVTATLPMLNPLEEVNKHPAAVTLPELHTENRLQDKPVAGAVANAEGSPIKSTGAAGRLGPLRELIQAIFQSPDELARQQMLASFLVRLRELSPKDDAPKGHPAHRLTAALEGLVKKLLDDPKQGNSTALLTITTAVDLLYDLGTMPEKSSLATDPPIRILAVDDDPIARRTITCALQMAFEKPESVDSGEAAIALAGQNPFDVIFMDVLMPGMDGFATCLKIHETDQNRITPVVFVTSCNDFKARSQASISGGCDFIAKPFLTAEVTVKALTYALRGRLQKSRKAWNFMPPRTKEEPKPDSVRTAFDGRILFVDDEEDWRTMVGEVLRGVGYEVVTAANATEAMRQTDGSHLGLVLLDINLAGEDGLALMDFLRCNQPSGVPVVLFTGGEHDEATVTAMRQAGANEYLRKGPMDELVGAVRSHFRPITFAPRRNASRSCLTGDFQVVRESLNYVNDHPDAQSGRQAVLRRGELSAQLR